MSHSVFDNNGVFLQKKDGDVFLVTIVSNPPFYVSKNRPILGACVLGRWEKNVLYFLTCLCLEFCDALRE